jgi:hypothetical protein
MSLVVELGPAEDSRDCSTEQHRVEENESADSRVRVLAEHHERDEPDGRSAKLELSGGEVGQGNTEDTKEGVEGAHEGVVHVFGILFSRLEFEGSVVTGEDARETDKHLSEGRVDVEVVFMLDVIAAKFTEAVGRKLARHPVEYVAVCKAGHLLCFVPSNNVALTDLPKSCSDGGESEEEGGNDHLPVVEYFEKARFLWLASLALHPYVVSYGTLGATYFTSKLLIISWFSDLRH